MTDGEQQRQKGEISARLLRMADFAAMGESVDQVPVRTEIALDDRNRAKSNQQQLPSEIRQSNNYDLLSLSGIIVVGIAAAILSFDIWERLATEAGFTTRWEITPPVGELHIAWLVPATIYIYAFTAMRLWLRSPLGSTIGRRARRNSAGAITLLIVGHGVVQTFEAMAWNMADCPPLVVVIRGVPLVVFGLAVHLCTPSRAATTLWQDSGAQIHSSPAQPSNNDSWRSFFR